MILKTFADPRNWMALFSLAALAVVVWAWLWVAS